jgi:hypothetical protein
MAACSRAVEIIASLTTSLHQHTAAQGILVVWEELNKYLANIVTNRLA